ncbi:PEP/pyruvate-binding domain-containing protein, partial [uncultured Fusobacterium sp.]
MKKVYSFNEGNKSMINLLGGKGGNLAEMTKIGLPIPEGIIISTQACKDYYKDGEKISKVLEDEILVKLD